MSPGAVVIALDVLKDFYPQRGPRLQWRAVNEFFFQRCKEALCYRVVPAVATPAHALPSLEALNLLNKGRCAVLATLVGVDQHPLGSATHQHGRLQRITDQLAIDALTELPTHYLAAKQVDEYGQI